MKTTRQAGIREAKARLSQLLRDVQLGREWVITERGKPVARLVPASATRGPLGERLKRLEVAGVIERRIGSPHSLPLPLPLPLPLANELARRILDDDRGP
jgi:prevent-host-death family protein